MTKPLFGNVICIIALGLFLECHATKQSTVASQLKQIINLLSSVVASSSEVTVAESSLVAIQVNIYKISKKLNHELDEQRRILESWEPTMREVSGFVRRGSSYSTSTGSRDQTFIGDLHSEPFTTILKCVEPPNERICTVRANSWFEVYYAHHTKRSEYYHSFA
ncbi:hypothetical protein [Beihai sea slater virus 4]|uniref:hypothetical protein n=1 Tax=Beihai sea slater virus 4 TaxID=1922660 RepID=UPI00090C4084|nr:hypothetical protein [Beihai sea slater virus 4]APG77555.1 hypothetical protein [Beihai sea slater virus 4]